MLIIVDGIVGSLWMGACVTISESKRLIKLTCVSYAYRELYLASAKLIFMIEFYSIINIS